MSKRHFHKINEYHIFLTVCHMTGVLVRGSCAYLEVVDSIEGGAIAKGTYLLRAQC